MQSVLAQIVCLLGYFGEALIDFMLVQVGCGTDNVLAHERWLRAANWGSRTQHSLISVALNLCLVTSIDTMVRRGRLIVDIFWSNLLYLGLIS